MLLLLTGCAALVACSGAAETIDKLSFVAETCSDRAPQVYCPKENKPVCATFTRTFQNSCALEVNKCGLAKAGYEFVSESDGNCCDRPRPFGPFAPIIDPVCGSDSVLYPNEFEMQKAACKKNDYIHTMPEAVAGSVCGGGHDPIVS